MNVRDTPAVRLVCAAAIAILALAAGAVPEHFTLDRAAVGSGELWRLWTGHLVHGSRAHFGYDVGAAVLLCLAFRPALWVAWVAPLISVLLLSGLPDLQSYYGLSALLHAWVVVSAIDVLAEERGVRAGLALALAAGTVCKAATEVWTGASLLTANLDFGGPVIHASHLVGALVGGLPFVLQRIVSGVRSAAASRSAGALASGHTAGVDIDLRHSDPVTGQR